MAQNANKNLERLYGEAYELFDKGNFRRATAIFEEILSLSPSENLREKTIYMLQKLRIDRTELIIGLVSLAVLSALFIVFGILG